MQRHLLTALCVLFSFTLTFGQGNYWKSVNEQTLLPVQMNNFEALPESYQIYQLDIAELKRNIDKKRSSTVLIPMPSGKLEAFTIEPSTVMPTELASKYPGIKSFQGVQINQPSNTIRLGVTYNGFHAVVFTPEGIVHTELLDQDNQTLYAVGYLNGATGYNLFHCGVEDEMIEAVNLDIDLLDTDNQPDDRAALRGGILADSVFVRRYDMALACTGEFARIFGGDTTRIMSSFTETMNLLNGLYAQEHGIQFQLVANNDQLIYTDAVFDPYDQSGGDGNLLGQNQTNLDQVIGNGNYDIGHVFTGRCTEFGGVASGVVCNNQNKGRGVTCFGGGFTSGRILGTMAHEIGHQFGAGHSWNNCPTSQGQRAGVSSFEPGSGSTIMSYNGACGAANNIPGGRFANFNVGAMVQIRRTAHETIGATCADVEAVDNHYPEITLDYEDGFFIPKNTPFKLVASATDVEDDDLTYSWEQYDLGPATTLGQPRLNAPLFRVFPPTTDQERYFPRWSRILSNTDNTLNGSYSLEVLPDYSRDMTFRVTVRDNHEGIAGVSWAEVEFNATAAAGPFVVSSLNDGATNWKVGDYVEISWDVANTDRAPVNCGRVNILLSIDGGDNFDQVLASGVRNDGSHFITVPDELTDEARIMIEAADNIFFDINNAEFSIEAATEPGYSFNPAPDYQFLCLPGSAEYTISSSSILGFDSTITVSVVDAPSEADITFSETAIQPGENLTINVDFGDVDDLDDLFEIEIQAVTGTDTIYRNLQIEVEANNFTTLLPLEPANGLQGAGEQPVFLWQGSPSADYYSIDIATDASFADNSIVFSETDLIDTTFASPNFLEKSQEYFWRVRGYNRCGAGPYFLTSAFHTETFTCGNYTYDDDVVNISSSGTPTVTVNIDVPVSGTVSEVSIPRIEGNHTSIKFLDVSLVSPRGTRALLMSDTRCNTNTINFGFDADATEDIPCPPSGGKLYKSLEPLTIFNGEDTQGEWKLEATVNDDFGDGGEIRSWELEFCSNVNLNGPFIVNNNPLGIRPGKSSQVFRNLLFAEDDDNTEDELIFTVVSIPAFGELKFNGQVLNAGDTFTQANIDQGNISYRHDGGDSERDFFTFTVKDGAGGWFGTPEFIINIGDDVQVSTNELEETIDIQLFPNPARDVLNVQFDRLFDRQMIIDIYNVQGQLMSRRIEANVGGQLHFDTSKLAGGIYFMRIQNNGKGIVRKFTVQR